MKTNDSIAWEDWEEGTFEKAKKEDKPILLSIGAKWCHWCHVMDSTSFSDPEIIKKINTDFIPIRVDNDRRPDINARYNMGGWPTTAILTPNGHVLTGETYINPERMKDILSRLCKLYKENRKAIYSEISKLKADYKDKELPVSNLENSIIPKGLELISHAFDSRYGGFGNNQKFPQVEVLTFCLKQYYESKNQSLKGILTKTLELMGDGGMYDHVEGGFFRYSTTRDWSVPHYEKMLEDNGKLAKLYLESYHLFKDEKYLKKALDIMGYLSKNLYDKRGGFYGSQDADENYYKLNINERRELRSPSIDKTIFTGWNSLAISTYLYAYNLTGNEDYLETSLKVLDTLRNKAILGGGDLLHHLSDGSVKGILEDQVFFSAALLDAYQITGENKYLKDAILTVDFMVNQLWNDKGAFYDKKDTSDDFGLLKYQQTPFATNSDAAALLIDLSILSGKPEYNEYAKKILEFFSSEYAKYGIMGSNYFIALSKFIKPPLTLEIVGSKSNVKTQQLLKSSLNLYHPHKLVQLLDPKKETKLIQKKDLAVPKDPTLYPCIGTKCLKPIVDYKKVNKTLIKDV